MTGNLPIIDRIMNAPDEKAAALELVCLPLNIMAEHISKILETLNTRNFLVSISYVERVAAVMMMVRKPYGHGVKDFGNMRVGVDLAEAGAALAHALWGDEPPPFLDL